jgi:hypothetical protein
MSAPRDRSWTDERITSAYRSLAGQESAPDVVQGALAAVGRAGERRSRTIVPASFRRPLGAFAGVAGVVMVAILVAILLDYRGGQTSTAGSPGPSAVPSNFATPAVPAQTVSQAIAAMAAGGLTDTDLLTVGGWLQPMPDLPIMSCPTFMPEYAFGIPADLRCGATLLTLSEPEDGQGPNFKIVVLDGTSLPEQLTHHPSSALQAVVVGHVHDRRASLCSTDVRAECEAAFVLDQVAWLDGKGLGPSVGVVSGQYGQPPTLSGDQVAEAVGKVLQTGSRVVSLTAVNAIDAFQSYSPGLAPSVDSSHLVWYVRVVGPPPTGLPMPGSQTGSGVLMLDDATLALLGAAGWGWDPTKTGIVMADGTVSLHTTEWLPGSICAGVGIDATLTGSRDDPRIAWLDFHFNLWFTPDPSYTPPSIIWPAGYRARFLPEIEIVDGSGTVVLRAGDHVGGACGYDPGTNTMYLEPPFQ